MAISEFEIKRCENQLKKFLDKHRPPAHVRHKLDISYRIEDQSVEIFEVAPKWGDSKSKMETPVAKTTYVKAHQHWKIFWYRQDMKWHPYEPAATVRYFEDFLNVVGEDEHACFFG